MTVSVYVEPETPVHVTNVTLNRTTAQLYTNHGASTVQLTADVKPADAADKTVTWSSSNPAVATVDEQGLVTVHAAGTAVVTATTKDGGFTAACTVTVSVYSDSTPSDPDPEPSNGGTTSSPSTTPPAGTRNEDGSTTTSVTDPATGAVTETTVWPSGERKVVTKESKGTTTEVVTKQNGSKRETVSKPDGSSRIVTTDVKGVKVETAVTSLGKVTAAVVIPEGVERAQVTVPFTNASASTVVYAVRDNGTREIIGAVVSAEGVSFTAKHNMTVEVTNRKIGFQDVPGSHWAADAIAFAAGSGLFTGVDEASFAPEGTLSRAMLFTVMARLQGVDTEGGEQWYSKAKDWAVSSGISDGSDPEASITREQLAAILYRYAGQPAASSSGSISFADSGEISGWANDAMAWAVSAGILNGKPGNLLEPASAVTRAELSAMLKRYIAWRSN